MKKILLIVSIIVITSSSYSQTTLPTLEIINSKYYKILPRDKTILKVDVSIKEFESTLDQLSTKFLSNGDSVLAKQIKYLHATVTYNKVKDTIIVNLSEFTVPKESPYYQSIEQIKTGFKKSVLGVFMQIKPAILIEILDGTVSKPTITTQQDTITVEESTKDNLQKLKFYDSFKKINVAFKYNGSESTIFMNSEPQNDKQLINYIELILPQIKSKMNLTYINKEGIVVLQQLNTKAEIPVTTYDVTFLFSNWIFK